MEAIQGEFIFNNNINRCKISEQAMRFTSKNNN